MSRVLPPNVPANAHAGATAKAGHAAAPHAKGSGGDSAAQAWQREMERAQMTQWLKPAVTASRTAALATPPARTAPARTGLPTQALAGGGPRGPASASTGQGGGHPAGSSAADTPMPPAAVDARQPQAARPAQEERSDRAPEAPPQTPGEGPLAGGHAKTDAPAANGRPVLPATPQQNADAQEQAPRPSLAVQRTEAARPPWLQPGMAAADAAGTDPQGTASEPLTDAPADTPHGADARPAAPGRQTGRAETLLRELPSVQGMRCHAQWSGDGRVDVWLGMDGPQPERAAQLAWAVSELRQSLSRQGHLLGTVVCNGRTVFEGTADARADGLDPTLTQGTPRRPLGRVDEN